MEVTGQKVRKRGYSGARLELIKKAASLSLEEYTIPEIARSFLHHTAFRNSKKTRWE
jgi:hypothetical protein